MDSDKLKPILEALFAASDKPLSVNQLFELFVGDLEQPSKDEIRKAIQELSARYEGSGFELKQVASGFRFQVRVDFETWVARMWEQKPPRYSRALMETLALIAYRQPITRGEIEDIRGVSVSTNIIKTLQERDWVKPLGHKEVPGRPTLYGTTRTFLDYFNLKSLNELPTLAEIRNLDHYNPEFEFGDDERRVALAAGAGAPAESAADAGEGDDSAAEASEAMVEAGAGDEAEAETEAATAAEAEAEPGAESGEKTETVGETEIAEADAAEAGAVEGDDSATGPGDAAAETGVNSEAGDKAEAEAASETPAAEAAADAATTVKKTASSKKPAARKRKKSAAGKKAGASKKAAAN